MYRAPVKASVDREVFRRTGAQTKKINVAVRYRGGIRL